jgi:peptide chain release factor 3
MSVIDAQVLREVSRRRTFAIISHPDAGKTTLTEKLLLFGGCIEVAGAVRGRKTQRAATSDWMELEKQRGISISSTVLTFEFEGHLINLLDTPGHHDFSEDTYRTLLAADCAVMVVDLAKGIEDSDGKAVPSLRPAADSGDHVRQQGGPAGTRTAGTPGRDRSQVRHRRGSAELALGHRTGLFRGHRRRRPNRLNCTRGREIDRRIEYRTVDLAQLPAEADMRADVVASVLDDVELLTTAGLSFDRQRFVQGELSPVFFGSALTNYGVEPFLRQFLALCPPPHDRDSDVGSILASQQEFTGFVFKIQANLDPRHRDRIAFVRVCSGRFRRDMEVVHARTGRKLRLRRAHRVFGQERETMDEAFPGDIVGLVNPGEFRLGDTICEGTPVNFEPLPQFSPENFAVLRCRDSNRRKQFQRGVEQLLEEGAIQMFNDSRAVRRDPILAAVGELQFDVVRFRLESEYDTATEIEWLPYKLARWIDVDPAASAEMRLPFAAKRVLDQFGHHAVLFQTQWEAEYTERENPTVRFAAVRAASLPFEGQRQPALL